MSTNAELYRKYEAEISKLASTDGYCTDLPLELIKVAKNVRSDLNLDEEFVESIKQQGILQPVLVMVTTEGRAGRFLVVLVAGHRRLAAAKQNGHKTIKCISKKLHEAQAIIAAVSENVNREALPPLDLADSLQDLANQGVERAEMESIFNRDKKTIARFLKMANWTAATKDLIREHPGHFNTRVLLALASKRKQPHEMEVIVRNLVAANPKKRDRRPDSRTLAKNLDNYFATRDLDDDQRQVILEALRYLKLLP